MRGVCLAPFRRLLLAGVALTAVPLFPAAAQGADKSGAAIPSSTDMPADSKRGSAIEEIWRLVPDGTPFEIRSLGQPTRAPVEIRGGLNGSMQH